MTRYHFGLLDLPNFDKEARKAMCITVVSAGLLMGISTIDFLRRRRHGHSANAESKLVDNLTQEMSKIVTVHRNLVSEMSTSSALSCLKNLLDGSFFYDVPTEEIIDLIESFELKYMRKVRLQIKRQESSWEFEQFLKARAELGAFAYWSIVHKVNKSLADPVGFRFHEASESLIDLTSSIQLMITCAQEYSKFNPDAEFRSIVGNLIREGDSARRECVKRKKVLLRDLARYMFTSSSVKVVCMGGSFAFVTVASYLMLSGHYFRRRIEQDIIQICTSSTLTSASTLHLSALLLLELTRCASAIIIDNFQQNFINVSTAHNREQMKMRLYLALARTPLSFFDLHSNDDVEEIVYYVNDLEGVDVHLQVYGSNLLKAIVDVATMFNRLATRSGGAGVFLFLLAIVSSTNTIEWMLKKATEQISARRYEMVDVEELENVVSDAASRNDVCGRVLLRGLSVFEHVHLLRPSGSDESMLRWWVNRVQQLMDRRDLGDYEAASSRPTFIIRRIAFRITRSSIAWIPAISKSFSSMTRSLLPVITFSLLKTVANGDSAELTPLYVAESLNSIHRPFSVLSDRERISDLLFQNAHKAHVLLSLLSKGEQENGCKLDRHQNAFVVGMSTGSLRPISITVSKLSFSYPSRIDRRVISSLDLHVPLQRGSFIALTGVSGSGKTTLLQLLMRLYDVKKGEGSITMQYEGYPKRGSATSIQLLDLPTVAARSLFSFVPQSPTILLGSIAQNISLDQVVSLTDEETLRRVKIAATHAQCSDFINALPERYLTTVSQSASGSDRNIKLSGGQAQRIGIARALYRTNCPILLMDEPTSSLDALTKTDMLSTMRNLLITSSLHCIVCVTHDITVLKEADVVIRVPEPS